MANDGECAGHEQAAQIAIPLFADTARAYPDPRSSAVCPIQAAKSRPERNAIGSATVATMADAPTKPIQGCS
jgi:hypothetical protein